jgi:hypothetical protein
MLQVYFDIEIAGKAAGKASRCHLHVVQVVALMKQSNYFFNCFANRIANLCMCVCRYLSVLLLTSTRENYWQL